MEQTEFAEASDTELQELLSTPSGQLLSFVIGDVADALNRNFGYDLAKTEVAIGINQERTQFDCLVARPLPRLPKTMSRLGKVKSVGDLGWALENQALSPSLHRLRVVIFTSADDYWAYKAENIEVAGEHHGPGLGCTSKCTGKRHKAHNERPQNKPSQQSKRTAYEQRIKVSRDLRNSRKHKK